VFIEAILHKRASNMADKEREREREREGVVTNTYLIKRERKSIMGSPRMRWFRDVEKKMFRI